jgi:hypothetical protein
MAVHEDMNSKDNRKMSQIPVRSERGMMMSPIQPDEGTSSCKQGQMATHKVAPDVVRVVT